MLTRLPARARVTPADALVLLDANFADTLGLPEKGHHPLLRELASIGIAGGSMYDGLVGAAARSAGLPLLTRDRRALATYAALGVEVEVISSDG